MGAPQIFAGKLVSEDIGGRTEDERYDENRHKNNENHSPEKHQNIVQGALQKGRFL
jgi:hypothetical protein